MDALTERSRQLRFLMCPPRHYTVSYSINPWMQPQAWADAAITLHAEAEQQWSGLCRTLLAAGAAIEQIEPATGLPDLVFTVNAAVVLDRKVVLSRFRHGVRRNEEPVFSAALKALASRGLIDEIAQLPPGIVLEGAGDCIWDRWRGLFWMGCGFRSDASAARILEQQLGQPCLALTLVDPQFYHLDTAFCPLPCGGVIYFPGALNASALVKIHHHVSPKNRIVLDKSDAMQFAANAICVQDTLVLSSCSEALRQTLSKRGYVVVETPLHAFLRGGGSARCLTLRLDHRSG